MGRILGIDYGSKRMGFAMSDPTQFLASSLSVFTYQHPDEPIREIRKLCEQHQIEKIVVGWPRNMDGSQGPMADTVWKFMEKLQAALGLPVEKWDERLSSKSAENVLIEAGTRREKRKLYVDKMAAQIMLQNYLDARGETDP